jgi:hypothetical protein
VCVSVFDTLLMDTSRQGRTSGTAPAARLPTADQTAVRSDDVELETRRVSAGGRSKIRSQLLIIVVGSDSARPAPRRSTRGAEAPGYGLNEP